MCFYLLPSFDELLNIRESVDYSQGFNMTKYEKDALLKYIEFHLISIVESVEDDVTGFVATKMYCHAHDVLADLTEALDHISTRTTIRSTNT